MPKRAVHCLLWAAPLQMLYSIRSERQLAERLKFDLWFGSAVPSSEFRKNESARGTNRAVPR